jgi:hypothetical protein
MVRRVRVGCGGGGEGDGVEEVHEGFVFGFLGLDGVAQVRGGFLPGCVEGDEGDWRVGLFN